MDRATGTRIILRHVTDEPIVASLGNPAYDLYLAGDRPENFYIWGGMGLAPSIGLGLALVQTNRKVIVLDGDGSLLMNLGALCTEAMQAPANLIHVVWDNGMNQLTGEQPTATARTTDLAAMARGAGIPRAVTVKDEAAFEEAFVAALNSTGPTVIVAKVEPGSSAGRPPMDPTWIKHRFMTALGWKVDGRR
ncbi:MAG: hypothetical protein HY331_02245 [Chloroflexi bacterium]|nr:hypothetical protein [Chloroflexota bacterium]